MPLPSKFNRMEVDFMLEWLGYPLSPLPRQDVAIYVNGTRYLAIDFNKGWDIPKDDLIKQLNAVDIPTERIEEAYRQTYPN